jgi:hypothetical protein
MSTIHRTPEHAHVPARRRPAIAAQVGGITALASIFLLALPGSSPAATSVGLGTAGSYAVLAGAGVTNTGPTVINGDLGSSPTPAITGFGGAPGGTVNGTIHSADADAASAQNDLTTAYNDAVGQGPPNMVATELGGSTLTPGVYEAASGTFGITGTLTLNAQGNPDAVFIFDAATTLTTATASRVSMINGAQACNVFWKVGSSATLGTDSAFAGNILALQSISLNDGVTVQGRLLARNGAVTLINDTVTRMATAMAPATATAMAPAAMVPEATATGTATRDRAAARRCTSCTEAPIAPAMASGSGSTSRAARHCAERTSTSTGTSSGTAPASSSRSGSRTGTSARDATRSAW